MEPKQEAQLVAQVRWRKGKLEEPKKIKGEEIKGEDGRIQTRVEYIRSFQKAWWIVYIP